MIALDDLLKARARSLDGERARVQGIRGAKPPGYSSLRARTGTISRRRPSVAARTQLRPAAFAA